MTALENLGTVLHADLLIVGGGMAGLACAISAKETDPEVDVLVVDKVVTGWGGKANKGGGNIVFVDPSELGDVLDFHVHNVGDFLEDQDLLMDFMRESRPDLERLESWGVHIYRDDAGEPKYVRWLPEHPWRLAVLDQDLTLNMAKHARKLGVRIQDRVEIVDLLKDGDRVCGAIGFGMIDGECVIAQAGAVVLANGNQCYKLMPRWASAGGEGIAAAYRAGAAMRGAEFGNFINWVFADTKEVCQGAEDCMYNAKGENISKRVRPVLESDVHSKEVVEWWKRDEGRQRSHRRQHDRELREQRDRAGVPRGQAGRPTGLDEVLGPDHRQGHGGVDRARPDAAGDARPQRRTRPREGRPHRWRRRSPASSPSAIRATQGPVSPAPSRLPPAACAARASASPPTPACGARRRRWPRPGPPAALRTRRRRRRSRRGSSRRSGAPAWRRPRWSAPSRT